MLLDKTKSYDPKEGWEFLQLVIREEYLYDPKLCTFVLERNFVLTAPDDSGDTLLHKAATKNDQFPVEELLQRGLDVGAMNLNGSIPLQIALEAGNFLVFLQLLRSSTEHMRRAVKFNEQSDGWNIAKRMAAYLLLREEYTLARDPGGRTALSWAAEYQEEKSQLPGLPTRTNLGHRFKR